MTNCLERIKNIYALQQNSNRVKWLDYTKAFAIMLVVAAHGVDGTNWFNIWAYSFHLPVFFIVSGYLIKDSMFSKSLVFGLRKYFKAIIVPYYVICFFIFIVEICKDLLQKSISAQSVMSLAYDWLLMVGLKADWFLPCLFFAIVINLILYKIFKGNKYLMFLPIAVLTGIPYFFTTDIKIINVFLHSFVASFFVYIGILLSDLKKKKSDLFTYIVKYKIPIFFVLLAINVLLCFVNGKVSLGTFLFGKSFILYLLNGIVGSFMLMVVCKIIESFNLRLLEYCGRNSIVIMATHMEALAFIGIVLQRFISQPTVLKIVNIIFSFIVSVILIPFVNVILNRAKALFKNF